MNITHVEPLPTFQPVTGPGRAQARRAALLELHEVRELLRYPGPAYGSPRIIRRYHEAVAWAAAYRDEK